jgi:hypothetical protein
MWNSRNPAPGRVTVTADDWPTCTCGKGPDCVHVEAVLCNDVLMTLPEPLSEAIKLVDPGIRVAALTRRHDATKSAQERAKLEAAIAALLEQMQEPGNAP